MIDVIVIELVNRLDTDWEENEDEDEDDGETNKATMNESAWVDNF